MITLFYYCGIIIRQWLVSWSCLVCGIVGVLSLGFIDLEKLEMWARGYALYYKCFKHPYSKDWKLVEESTLENDKRYNKE